MKPGYINPGYDVELFPTADEFDPVAWFEGTGEDLGLTDEYKRDYDAALAEHGLAPVFREDPDG